MEEQVGGFGFEGDVADLVDDEQRVAAEPDELGLQPAGVVGVGEPGDPFGGGGEQDPVPGLAGADRQPDREVGLAGAGWAEEHDVVAGGDEVQGAQVGDGVAFEAAGVVEVELLQATCGPGSGRRGCGPRRRGTSRAETSRCRQATRNSSWVQDSARARSASRGTDSRSVGAFNARVRNASSAARSRAGFAVVRAWPSRHPAVDAEHVS